jgi:transketolase
VPVITDVNGKPVFGEDYTFEYGKIDTIRSGKVPLISFGGMLYRAVKVKELLDAKGIDIGVYNASCPAHLDKTAILELAKSGKIFTYEDHNPYSGLYASVCEIIAAEGIACKVIPFGVTEYAYSGAPDDIFKLIGLSPEAVAGKIESVSK